MIRAYRYLITESSGCLAKQVPVGSHIIDWTYFGSRHTWNVIDFKLDEITGTMTGVFVDKGYKTDDGNYYAKD